ncbi:MAG: hypothetical protein ABSB97_04560 [Thermoplasmata archaeon]|jgi:hypothetical protein
MIGAPSLGRIRRPPAASSALVLVVGGFLGYLTALPHDLGVVVAVVGVGVGIGMREFRSFWARSLAPVPLLLAFGFGVVASPLGVVPELGAGAAGLAFLIWLADDPGRSPGGVERARTTILVPALALGIAWSSALLLPSGSYPLGVAAGLLVFAVAALAYLVSRPGLFDREEAATY